MKKRRIAIISMLLIVAITLGIGYANITTKLLVRGGGNISVNTENFSVVFTDVDYDDTKYTATASGTTATFDVSSLNTEGSTAVFTYTIENQSIGKYDAILDENIVEEAVILTRDSDNATLDFDTYYEVDTELAATTLTAEAPNNTTTLTVTVTCKKSLVADATLTYRFHFNASAGEDVTDATTAAPVEP